MSESRGIMPASESGGSEPASPFRLLLKHVMAGNPFYLASAGLLLYGINQLTTDPRLVGAEFPLLRFNFCALVLYEIMLVCTAIALMRRGIWYDALLLFGLTNVFIIVPFSLISRAVFLSTQLAAVMSVLGTALAVGKFWAFARYAPELKLPRRLLVFGTVLLLANAYAPILFKDIANDLDQVTRSLNCIWLLILPALAGLGYFLPQPAGSGGSTEARRWLPVTMFFAWVIVTACHFGGIGYSTSYVWDYSLAVPVAWVSAWILYFRLRDFTVKGSRRVENFVLFVPLLVPLLAVNSEYILLLFAGLNLAGFGLLYTRKRRDLPALIQLLGATTIFCGSLPVEWISHLVPGVVRVDWILLSLFVCFFWMIFRSRDPRVAMTAAVALVSVCPALAPGLSHYVIEAALVSVMAHSLRWDDQAHWGAATFRALCGMLWVLLSWAWLFRPVQPARLLVDSSAVILLVTSLLYAALSRQWKSFFVPFCATIVLLSQPAMFLANWLREQSAGVVAIVGSFLLFAAGSVAAFSKPRWWRSGSA